MEQKRSNDETVREMQQCLLGTLKAIHEVCREHGLTYYLVAGTMLGAVRHKGFIPWDDDADVAMPRPDYEALLAHAAEWLPERYELVRSGHPENYPYTFARIQDSETTYLMRRSFSFVGGVPVDVFPLDGMCAPGLRRRWHFFRYRLCLKLLYFTQTDPYKHGRGLRSGATLLLRRLFTPAGLYRWIDRICTEWDYDASDYVVDHDFKSARGVQPKAVYGQAVPVEFAGTTLMGVARPDDYLRCCYGNYMELPKEIPVPNFRLMDLKKPYRRYLEDHPRG